MPERLDSHLRAISERVGVAVEFDGRVLTVDSHRIDVPQRKQDWENLRIRQALPYAAHGDQREHLLYKIIQDSGQAPDGGRVLDEQLREELEDLLALPGSVNQEIVADAMKDEYWITPSKRPILLPYQSRLPLTFDHSQETTAASGIEIGLRRFKAARYRMFDGYILPFLCWTGSSVDLGLIDALLDVAGSDEGLSLLDKLFFGAVASFENSLSGTTSERLLDRAALQLEALKVENGGPFCQPSFDHFRRDLGTVLGMELSRRDRIDAITLVLSLHLATYYYRLAIVLGAELDMVSAAVEGTASATPPCDCSSLGKCPLAGQLKFRAPSRGFRSVSLEDPCRQAYLRIDRDKLLALPANIVTANLLEQAWAAITGRPSVEGTPRPREIAAQIAVRDDLRPALDASASALAVLYTDQVLSNSTIVERVVERRPGPFALQSAVTQAMRTRLRYTSRDVMNQLAFRPGEGSLLRKNGSFYYFELDEDMLFLLVKLVCRDDALPFDSFLSGLSTYGLAPQNSEEESALAATLEDLGMLTRYSDAGESTYVRHIF